MAGRRPPRIGPKGPQRNQIRPPAAKADPEEQVEMTKLDPQELLEAARQAQGGPAPMERTSEEHLQPMNFREAPAVKPPQEEQPVPEVKLPPPKEADDPIDRGLPTPLVERLAARFKLKPEFLVEDVLECGGEKVPVSLRKPVYDDFLWTLGVLEEKIQTNEDTALIQGAAQQARFLQHLTAARTVMKIEGEWVWDAFNYRGLIQAAIPDWDGETFSPIPENFRGALAQSVHTLFRQLHPDMLFELDRVTRKHFPAVSAEEDEEEEGTKEPEGPTPAA